MNPLSRAGIESMKIQLSNVAMLKHLTLSLLLSALTSASVAEETVMTCGNRDYKLITSENEQPIFQTKINGNWITACDESYLPLNRRRRDDNGGWSARRSLSRQVNETQGICFMRFEESNSDYERSNTFYKSVIDFKDVTYSVFANSTGIFVFDTDFESRTQGCVLN